MTNETMTDAEMIEAAAVARLRWDVERLPNGLLRAFDRSSKMAATANGPLTEADCRRQAGLMPEPCAWLRDAYLAMADFLRAGGR